MKNIFWKDIFRDFRKSFSRFLGMFAIVGLGVFVFTGLGSMGVLMKRIGNDFFQQHDFMDIQVISTYGLNRKDLKALEETPGVSQAVGAYTMDAILAQGQNPLAVKIHSLDIGIHRDSQPNQPELLTGRLPEKGNETVVEAAFLSRTGLTIGDTIRLQSGRSSDIRTKLKTDTFHIVGTVQSPLYFSTLRGSSSVGTGETDCYILLPKEIFRQSIYTEAYLRVDGVSSLFIYGDPYQEQVDEVIQSVKDTGDKRIPLRKREATRQGWGTIDQAEKKLEKSSVDAQQKLAQGELQLLEEQRKLDMGRMDLAAMEGELADQMTVLDLQQQEIRSGLEDLNAAIATIKSGEDQLQAKSGSIGQNQQDLYRWQSGLKDGKELALGMSAQLYEGITQVEQGLLQIDAYKMQIQTLQQETANARSRVEQQLEQAQTTEEIAALTQKLQELDEKRTQLAQAFAQTVDEQKILEGKLRTLYDKEPELLESFQELRSQKRQMNRGQVELSSGYNQLHEGLSSLTALRQELEAQRLDLENSLQEIQGIYLELDAAAQSLAQNRIQVARGSSTLRQGENLYQQEKDTADLMLEEARSSIDKNKRVLRDLDDPKWYVLDRNSNLGYGSYADETDQIGDIGSVIPLLFFLVAALVSLTTMTRLVEEQRVVMGTYKALGYSNIKILSKYLLFAFVPTFFGSTVGGYLGFRIFPDVVLIQAFGGLFTFPPFEDNINYGYWVVGLLLAVCSTTLTTLSTCWKELRSAPSTLMRPRSPVAGKKTPLEYLTVFWTRLSFLYKVSFRNIFRYKKRLFMTLAGVGGSTALLLAGLGLHDSLIGMVDTQFRILLPYDITVSFADGTSASSLQSTRRELIQNPQITQDLVLRREQVKVHMGDGKTEDAALMTPEQLDISNFILLRKRLGHDLLELTDSGVILSEQVANAFQLEVGDSIVMRNADDEEFWVTVSGICEAYLGNALYMSSEYYESVTGKAPVYNAVLVREMNGVSPQDELLLSDWLLQKNGVVSVTLSRNTIETNNDIISGINAVVVLIVFIAALLAFVVLINLTNINIVERTREIATIEVLGFRDNEVATYIYRENIFVSLAASLMGVFLGKYLHTYLCKTIEGGNMMMMRDVSPVSFVLAVALTMAFTVGVAFLTQGKLKKINMIEALKSVD